MLLVGVRQWWSLKERKDRIVTRTKNLEGSWYSDGSPTMKRDAPDKGGTETISAEREKRPL